MTKERDELIETTVQRIIRILRADYNSDKLFSSNKEIPGVRTTIILQPDLYETLKKISRQTGKSQSLIIRE